MSARFFFALRISQTTHILNLFSISFCAIMFLDVVKFFFFHGVRHKHISLSLECEANHEEFELSIARKRTKTNYVLHQLTH